MTLDHLILILNSCTFQIILESEMDKAYDQKGIVGTEFSKQQFMDRPSSSASNRTSNYDVNTIPPKTQTIWEIIVDIFFIF